MLKVVIKVDGWVDGTNCETYVLECVLGIHLNECIVCGLRTNFNFEACNTMKTHLPWIFMSSLQFHLGLVSNYSATVDYP